MIVGNAHGGSMYTNGLLAPMVALIAWSLVMWAWLYATRIPAMRRLKLSPQRGRFAREMNQQMPDHARQVADNYNHLMEQPTIFYAVCVVLQLLGQGDQPINIGLAWGYVVLRVAHSLVQSTVNHVATRFTVFAVSTLCLIALTVHAVVALR
jgi:hypothetical protein